MTKIVDSMKLNGEVELCLKEAVRQTDLEFEWIYGDINYPDKKKLTKELFMNLKHFFNSSLKYIHLEETNNLDIRCEFRKGSKSIMSNIRATVEGVKNIKQYCLQDNFDDLEPIFIRKTRYRDPKNKSINYGSAESGLYPCRTTLKEELKLVTGSKEVGVFLNNWSSKNKFFRYKKRYSYTTPNRMWRIDLTAIKSSDKGKFLNQYSYSKTFREAGILQKEETFELEIEFIGSFSNTFAPAPIHEYAKLLDLSPFNLDNVEEEGNIFVGDVSFGHDDDTQEMAYIPDSPRYGPEIEYDEPIVTDYHNFYKDRYIPGHITINDDYWKGSGQDDVHLGYNIYKHGFEVQDLGYKFNHMTMFSEKWNKSADRFASHIIHYAGQGVFDSGVRTGSEQLRHDYAKIYG